MVVDVAGAAAECAPPRGQVGAGGAGAQAPGRQGGEALGRGVLYPPPPPRFL